VIRTGSPCRRAVAAPVAGLALVIAAASGSAHAVETSFDAGAEAAYDTNVTRAQFRDDIRADGYAAAHGGATLRWPLGDHDAASLGATVRGTGYLRFPRLSSVGLDATLAYQRKLGVGMTAPWLSASARLSYENYVEDTRDSDRLEVRVETGRRITEALDVSAGYVYDRRFAKHDDVIVPGMSGAVWDIVGNGAFARAGYALGERWLLDAGYAYRRGDVVSTSHRNRAVFLASEAIGVSTAFGPGFFDYRIRGTTHAANATLSYALGDRASLNLAYVYAVTRAVEGLQYESHQVAASWVYRY
jgi:hypothetical protein